MKRPLLFLFLVASFAAVAQSAEDETLLTSTIKEVRVYLNRAAIHETASLSLQPGDHILVFTGLSRQIQPQSIQVRGNGRGIIQSVTYRTSYLSRTPKTRQMLALEDSIAALSEELEEIANTEFVLGKELELILKNNQLGDDGGLTTEELQRLSAFYAKRIGEIKAAQLRATRRKKDVSDRRSEFQRQLGEINKNRNLPTEEVVVAYKASSAGRIALELDYLVSGASWSPVYDLRAQSNRQQPIALSLKANVVNNTGVDWKGVRLTLSTANPATGGTPPSIYTQYLDRYEPQAARRERSAFGSSGDTGFGDDAFADEESGFGEGDDFGEAEEPPAPAAETAASYTTTTRTALAVEYQIAIPYDVSTDGKPRLVDVQDFKLDATYAHYSAPRYDTDAFLQARIHGWDQYDLLPGKANVYLDGAFLTETSLNPSTTKDTLPVGLGRDPGVVVEREQVRDFTSKKAIGSNIRETRGYTIDVRNTKAEAVTLVVEDQIPVSKNKDILVELGEGHGSTYTSSTGRLRWEITLAPGETRTLRFQFEVKYPKDWTVTGL